MRIQKIFSPPRRLPNEGVLAYSMRSSAAEKKHNAVIHDMETMNRKDFLNKYFPIKK